MIEYIKYALLGLLLVSAVLIAICDAKYQKIPIWLLLINYSSFALLTNLWLLLGLAVILLAKFKDIPIDVLYLAVMGYLIIIVQNNILAITLIVAFLVFVLGYVKIFKSKEKIPAMLPLEFCISVLTTLYVCTNNWTVSANFIIPT